MRSRGKVLPGFVIMIAAAVAALVALSGGCVANSSSEPLRVALAPYQDMALLTLHDDYALSSAAGLDLELVTVTWEDLLPSIASAGETTDVAFAGLHEYLTKYNALNAGSDDPILYIYPLYVFKGGAFVTFDEKVPDLTARGPLAREEVERFLRLRIASQKYSTFHMMLASLARRHGISPSSVVFVDVPLDDGLLAAQAGSVDVAATGLTQRTEAVKRGARVVLDMDVAGFADITGFVTRRSTLEERRAEIEKLLHVWFACVDRFWADPEREAPLVIAYLNEQSATDFDVPGLLTAMGHEYFPRTVREAQNELLATTGSFPLSRISELFGDFLVESGLAKSKPPIPQPIDVSGVSDAEL